MPQPKGDVLDFGCGMNNLSFATASQGCKVSALGASPATIERIAARAMAAGARISVALADVRD